MEDQVIYTQLSNQVYFLQIRYMRLVLLSLRQHPLARPRMQLQLRQHGIHSSRISKQSRKNPVTKKHTIDMNSPMHSFTQNNNVFASWLQQSHPQYPSSEFRFSIQSHFWQKSTVSLTKNNSEYVLIEESLQIGSYCSTTRQSQQTYLALARRSSLLSEWRIYSCTNSSRRFSSYMFMSSMTLAFWPRSSLKCYLF